MTEKSEATARPRQIVVVDDNSNLCQMMVAALAREGYKVREANDGKVALDLLATTPADLVITDIMMPESDGYQLVMDIQKRHPQTIIVAISGNMASGHRMDLLDMAKQLGVAQTLLKPFAMDELITVVRHLLRVPSTKQ